MQTQRPSLNRSELPAVFQMDSVFSLRRPYDLLALLAQEERAVQVEEFKQQLLRRKQEIDRCEDQASDVEQRLYSTDKDCILAAQPLTDFDLYVSTVVPFDHKIQRYDDDDGCRFSGTGETRGCLFDRD